MLLKPALRDRELSRGRETGYVRSGGWDSVKRGGNLLAENESTSPDQLMEALKRYLKDSGETERAVSARIGLNYHTLRRWLSDKDSPNRGKLALTAHFLRQAGYL
jgi:hypothetical protein